jgi:O-antigen/teichoic acid export membrane protein
MMALRLRKQNLIVSFGGVLLKFALFVPLIVLFGYKGSIYSKAINQLVLFLINMYLIKKTYQVRYSRSIRRVVLMFIGLFAMQISFFALRAIGLVVIDQGRIVALVELAVYGVIGVLAYLLTTSYFRLPQRILNLDIKRLIKKGLGS